MIPKVINYCWFGGGPLPGSVKLNIDSWKKFCPDYKIIQWNEKNFDVNKYCFAREAYEKKKWAFVSDVARLDIIYKHGGIYLDTDVELIKSLDPVLNAQSYFACEDRFSVNTGLGFGSVKKNEFILSNLKEYKNKHFINSDGSLNKILCVDVTTHLLSLMGFKANESKQIINGMVIYPSSYFCPIQLGHRNNKVSSNTISIHHYSASWKEASDNIKGSDRMIILKKYIKHYVDYICGYGTYNKFKKISRMKNNF